MIQGFVPFSFKRPMYQGFCLTYYSELLVQFNIGCCLEILLIFRVFFTQFHSLSHFFWGVTPVCHCLLNLNPTAICQVQQCQWLNMSLQSNLLRMLPINIAPEEIFFFELLIPMLYQTQLSVDIFTHDKMYLQLQIDSHCNGFGKI